MASAAKLVLLFVVACKASPVDLPVDGTLDDEEPSSKIVGGTQAAKNEFPYQLLMLVQRRDGTGLCGASILNAKWAISAAHCFENNTKPGDVTLKVGYRSRSTLTGGEYDVKASRIVIHPQYSTNTQRNDLALIQIDSTFRNTTGSKPVKLPQQGARPTGDAIATGWGTTSEQGSSPSDILMKVTLPIVADSNCRNRYGTIYDSNSQLCAGVLAGGKDTCQGDSGGPLVLNGVQLGITSYGAGCARENTPGVYTRVSYFRNYIREITGA